MLGAREIADALGVPRPTDEQEAVIEAPLEGVYRVVAGAGSGKTETMALRVLYLVANNLVSPSDVLGLTFTKKAALELSTRLSDRIRQLARVSTLEVSPDPFDAPRVQTYNAFATRLFGDYAVYLGIDGDVTVASAASAWGLARQVVRQSVDPRLSEFGIGVDSMASLVVSLDHQLGEHDVEPDRVRSFVERFTAVRDLPPGGTGGYPEVDRMVEQVGSLNPLLDLVDEFSRAKAERGLVEFSDQVRLALRVARSTPRVIEEVRGQHRVVLLDEYQDTSVLQTALLQTLFADHPVMAVGDPHQAIYGWRGASAGNLADFVADFSSRLPHRTFTLSTSWRNSEAVLTAANTLATPLTHSSPHAVVTLRPRPDVPPGQVDAQVAETVAEEAQIVASWFADRVRVDGRDAATAAVLLRTRAHQEVFVRALTHAGVPVHVLGIGGLLSDPVVADLVCGLAVVHRPEANTELVRLLAGGRFRVGPADLYQLSRVAGMLRRSSGGEDASGTVSRESERETGVQLSLSLIEAVDFLARQKEEDSLWEGFSEAGRERLIQAQHLIAKRRAHVHDDLADQLLGLERALQLDIELRANPERLASGAARAALFDAVSSYQAVSDEPGATGFLAWLQEAEARDNLQPRPEPAEPGCVQVLTIHGAKGLEWDYVAIPRMVEEELPGKLRDTTRGWIHRGILPYPLRGDHAHLPQIDFWQAESRREFRDQVADYSQALADHHLSEERRLAYVAITRAKREVLLTGSWWATQQAARGPSRFLQELVDAGVVDSLPEASAHENNPDDGLSDDTPWPGDPLGSRRAVVEGAARAVTEVLERGSPKLSSEVEETLLALLAREQRGFVQDLPPWPSRLPASSLALLLADPVAVMRRRSQSVPRRVTGAERSGTAFHEWVEDYYRAKGGVSLVGDFDLDDGAEDEPVDLEAWRKAFLASPFAGVTPLAIEREIILPVGQFQVVCKMDAVFSTETGVDIIDWKTGRPPSTDEEERARSLQLSLYRLAWAQWSGLPPQNIQAGWWFSQVATLQRPRVLLEKAEVEAMVARSLEAYLASTTNS